MKRLLAILLLMIHLFNFAGHSLIFHYLMQQSDARLVKRIDAGRYDRNSLMILKVPLQLPYHNDWKDFERVDGEIEIQGVHYTYVERKLSKDTLYLACLPNQDKTDLSRAQHEYATGVDAIPANGKKDTNSNVKKNISGSEYNYQTTCYQFNSVLTSLNTRPASLLAGLNPGHLSAPYAPPDPA